MNQDTLNKISRTLGVTLIKAGYNFIRSSLKIQPIETTRAQLSNTLKAYGYQRITLSDKKYRLLSIERWKEIIEIDWTDHKQYVKEFYDCDNFAFAFASRMAEVFGINSAGVVYGQVHNKDTQKWIGSHFWNAIITSNFQIYFYEPINDMIKKDIAGQHTIIDQMDYYPLTFRFF